MPLPQKRFYRQRAHANPFADHQLIYPPRPEAMNWTEFYPAFALSERRPEDVAETGTTATPTPSPLSKPVEVADIGCGFGGLLVALGPKMPDTLLLGLEIRVQVTQYVQDRIRALRKRHEQAGLYQNVACLRANTMKFLPNFFEKAQLRKIFICFPDPHFKTRKHKARIVSAALNSEYAFVLRPGGIVYTISDVEELHKWIDSHFKAHPSFERLTQDEEDADECVLTMKSDTEEGKKVERNKGTKFVACYRRLEDPPWP